jgi:murein DD-endopeptidase MepM/ murein hydrolase activator NlpD
MENNKFSNLKGKVKTMEKEKKFKLSDRPLVEKIIYAVVIAVLCISAIVVGIISAASREDANTENEPPISDGNIQGDENGNTLPPESDEGNEKEQTSFISPSVGTVVHYHSLETPVFSTTLGEWRIHTGIDIGTEDGADVFAAAAGTVSAVYDDPFMGRTVEITHTNNMVTLYSNLAKEESLAVGTEVTSGQKIGTVGDTSIKELAEEPHLHFEMKIKGASVNPLDYIDDASKKSSLGIVAE